MHRPGRSGWRWAALALAGGVLGRAALADEPKAARPAFTALFERAPVALRQVQRPGVRSVQPVNLRTDLLEKIRFGEPRPVEIPLARGRALKAWVGAPDAVDHGYERWPVTLEACDDPFCSVLLVASPPRRDGTPDAAAKKPSAGAPSLPPGTALPAGAAGGAGQGRHMLMWIRSVRYGNWELLQRADGGPATLRELDFSTLGECGTGGTAQAHGHASGGQAGRRDCCDCCRGGGVKTRGGGAGDQGAGDVEGHIVPLPPPGSSTMTTIDLLVAYSTWAVWDMAALTYHQPPYTPFEVNEYLKAEATLQLSIVAAVQDLNDVFAKSMVPVEVRLAGPMGEMPCPVGLAQVQDCHLTWQQLTQYPDVWQQSVRNLRSAYRADLVCVVAEGGTGPSNLCGFGSIYDENLPLAQRREQCYSVVRSSCLANRTLAHEVGHNLGACHFSGDGSASSVCWGGDRHPHSFWYWDPGAGQYIPLMTLMGRNPPGYGARVDVFSTADRWVPGIGWLGSFNTANNARIVRSAAYDVSQYFP